jgi:hypothetical protein
MPASVKKQDSVRIQDTRQRRVRARGCGLRTRGLKGSDRWGSGVALDARSSDQPLFDTVPGKSGPAHIQGREINFQLSALKRLHESFDYERVEVGPRAPRDGLLGV